MKGLRDRRSRSPVLEGVDNPTRLFGSWATLPEGAPPPAGRSEARPDPTVPATAWARAAALGSGGRPAALPGLLLGLGAADFLDDDAGAGAGLAACAVELA